MPPTLLVKRSTTPGTVPTLQTGEIFLNLADLKLFTGTGSATQLIANGNLFASQVANLVWASPSSTTGAPAYRYLVPADLGTGTPSSTTFLRGDGTWASVGVSGTVLASQGGTGITSYTYGDMLYANGSSSTLNKLAGNTTTVKQFLTSTGTGSAAQNPVWSVIGSADLPNFSASLITSGVPAGILKGSAGVLAAATAGTDYLAPFTSQTVNYVYAAPSSSNGIPGFRALVPADIPGLPGTIITSGTIGPSYLGTGTTNSTTVLCGDGTWKVGVTGTVTVAQGGTYITSYTYGDMIYASGTTNLSSLHGNSTTTKQFLTSTGTGSAANPPVWGAISASDLPGGIPTGMLKGSASNFAAATAGTDYLAPFTSQTANYVYAAPSGGGVPSFRSISSGTLSDFPSQSGQSGNFLTTNGTTLSWGSAGASAPTTATYILQTSAGGALPDSQVLASLTTGIVKNTTTTGVLSIAIGSDLNTTFGSQNQNYVYAAPAGSNGTPSFRQLVAGDIPPLSVSILSNFPSQTSQSGNFLTTNGTNLSWAAINASNITTGTLGAAQGGTGNGSYSVGDMLYASGAAAISRLGGNVNATRYFLGSTGTGVVAQAPAWAALAASDIPSLPTSKITSGTFSPSLLGTGTPGNTTFLRGDGLWATLTYPGQYSTTFTSGSLTSGTLYVNHGLATVDVVVDVYDNGGNQVTPTGITITDANDCTVNLSDFTITGTWTVVVIGGSGGGGGTFASQTQNSVFAAPSTGSGTPSFRLLALSDLPALATSNLTDFPAQASHSGTYLTTNGTTLSWGTVSTASAVVLAPSTGVNVIQPTADCVALNLQDFSNSQASPLLQFSNATGAALSTVDASGYAFLLPINFVIAAGVSATTGTDLTNWYLVQRDCKLVDAYIVAKTGPVGAPLSINIEYSNSSGVWYGAAGTSAAYYVWSNAVAGTNQLSITSGNSIGRMNTFNGGANGAGSSVSSLVFLRGTLLRIDVTSVGSTTAGQNVTVELLCLAKNQV